MKAPSARAIDESGKPVMGAQVLLVDSAGRIRSALPLTDEQGAFTLPAADPTFRVLLAHRDHVRVVGPLPPGATSYEMKRKASAFRSQIKGAPKTRIAYVERDEKGLIAMFECVSDDAGMFAIPKEPGCTYRIVPFLETSGGMKRVTENLDIVPIPELESLATELRFKNVTLIRKTELETTYRVEPNIHLRFFFLPRSLDEAIAFAPLLEAYDETRDSAREGVHDAFCTVRRAGGTNGIGYSAYEVPGESLEEIVQRTGPLSEGECVDLGRTLSAALPALEKRGLVHANIAPRFVYRGSEGWKVAPPCPATRLGSWYERSHRLHEGADGDDARGVGATVHFAATGRAPEDPFRPTGRAAVDALLQPLLR